MKAWTSAMIVGRQSVEVIHSNLNGWKRRLATATSVRTDIFINSLPSSSAARARAAHHKLNDAHCRRATLRVKTFGADVGRESVGAPMEYSFRFYLKSVLNSAMHRLAEENYSGSDSYLSLEINASLFDIACTRRCHVYSRLE